MTTNQARTTRTTINKLRNSVCCISPQTESLFSSFVLEIEDTKSSPYRQEALQKTHYKRRYPSSEHEVQQVQFRTTVSKGFVFTVRSGTGSTGNPTYIQPSTEAHVRTVNFRKSIDHTHPNKPHSSLLHYTTELQSYTTRVPSLLSSNLLQY